MQKGMIRVGESIDVYAERAAGAITSRFNVFDCINICFPFTSDKSTL